jgi:outer membrane protein assembly factor BamD
MKQNLLKLFIASVIVYFITGCSAKKETQEYNKPAVYWYNKMIKQISTNRLDDADDTFVSLESEHRKSPLLQSAMIIIINAHIEEEEYAMANYYLDEYLKKFTQANEVDYIRFLKIKSNFLAFKQQYREQKLLKTTLEQTDEFLKKYPKSQYIYLVQDIKSRLLMAKSQFDNEIAQLYTRIDKPKASKYYEQKAKKSWKKPQEINKVDVPWYRVIFE